MPSLEWVFGVLLAPKTHARTHTHTYTTHTTHIHTQYTYTYAHMHSSTQHAWACLRKHSHTSKQVPGTVHNARMHTSLCAQHTHTFTYTHVQSSSTQCTLDETWIHVYLLVHTAHARALPFWSHWKKGDAY